MRRNFSLGCFLIVVATPAIFTACNSGSNEAKPGAAANSGKVPVTTKSEEARKEFLARPGSCRQITVTGFGRAL